MLQFASITREQFQSLSPQEQRNMGAKYVSAFNAHQQQQQLAIMNAGLNNNAFPNQTQNQNFYDRPSSSASSHSQQPSSSNQMMPPPPPRPPTAQGGHLSRPGTSLAHRSPTIPASQQAQMLEMMHMKEMMQQGQQRSQSRMVCYFLPLLINTHTLPRLIEPTP
jgi:SWI/SNF-related matrix-associated actin-dependent regulator of chromatin subfamily B protein 1